MTRRGMKTTLAREIESNNSAAVHAEIRERNYTKALHHHEQAMRYAEALKMPRKTAYHTKEVARLRAIVNGEGK